jgi:putative long chain acyl-CoA synthase
MGSGMPRGLWKRITGRFAPARVLEFYASTEGEAILVNLTGEKAGSMGRPLPGSAEVRLAAFDTETTRMAEGPDGFAVPCGRHDAGLLLSRVRPDAIMAGASTLRGVFEAGDAWLSTGDLFRRDLDGDYWMVDHVPALMRTAKGAVPARPIQDALADIDEVRLAIAYAVKAKDGVTDIPVAAVTLGPGRTLDPAALDETLRELGDGRPHLVHIVDEIPVTTWYRPVARPLRTLGVPSPAKPARAWYLAPASDTYKPLTKAARTRLLEG